MTDLGRRIQIEDVPYDAPVFNSILSLDRDPRFLYTCACAVCKENDVSGFTPGSLPYETWYRNEGARL